MKNKSTFISWTSPLNYMPLIKEHRKRYVLRFETWTGELNKLNEYVEHNDISVEEFDTSEELNDAVKLYEEIYKDTPRPIKINEEWFDKVDKKYKRYSWQCIKPEKVAAHSEFPNGAKYWGYMLIDFDEERIIDYKHDVPEHFKNWKTDLKLKDRLFRKENEIPKDYKWENGEYDGWLQFRWGNGLNAIDVEDKLNKEKQNQKKPFKPKPTQEPFDENDCLEDYYIEQDNKRFKEINAW